METSLRTIFLMIVGLLTAALIAVAVMRRQTDAHESRGGAPASDSDAVAGNQPTRSPDVAIPVEGTPVARATLVISISAAGQAAASRQTTLLAQVAGRVERLPVRESDRASAAQLLVALEAAEFQLAVRDAQARLEKAQASYRVETLFDDREADSTIRNQRAQIARARSGIAEAEVALEKATLDLRRATVRAPFEGVVANLKIVAGQQVRAGDELLVVQDLDPIKVELQVLESEIGFLAPGRSASVSFAAFPDQRFAGRIETINPMVEPNTRTARVTVVVPNPARKILPGMYARVALDARRFTDRVLVPRSAVLERDRRTMLFVFDAAGSKASEGLAKWRYVTTGLANDSLVEIVESSETDEVKPGEIVLTGGHQTLIHDARVKLVDNALAAGGRP
ncbi:MAG: efflux RND transporter periplasmic adaptor subunit [Gemmatimonadaceae bacterium]|nr:efflux RND transporter periplasmic adaptor subunit [Gemmatimonadaceae bacterium]MDQ3519450.1 efflux RND transporter periplasmic adaptor subunit [Gemmatimonadota bacterium]